MTSESGSVLRLIAGSGRSGTTWVLDALAEANVLRPVFEPLHTETSSIGARYGHAHLTADSRHEDLLNFFSAAVRGNLNAIWTDYRIKPGRLRLRREHLASVTELKALAHRWRDLASRFREYRLRKARSKTLLKCIRANLMLDWIHAHFDARIMLLMRHPGAAIESRLRFGEHWDPFPLLERYRSDRLLMEGALSAHSGTLRQCVNRAEALTAIWCIENLVPAAQAAANGYTVVFYEELLERPEVEWARAVESLGLRHVPSAQALEKPSQQAASRLQQDGQPAGSYSVGYDRWRARVTDDDLARIDAVLRKFDVSFYDVSEARPRVRVFENTFLSPGKEELLVEQPL
ncbi:hypothetical protein BH24PSE2_BH24PSE2_12810 [soil metagenome]